MLWWWCNYKLETFIKLCQSDLQWLANTVQEYSHLTGKNNFVRTSSHVIIKSFTHSMNNDITKHVIMYV